jgi:Subtilase family
MNRSRLVAFVLLLASVGLPAPAGGSLPGGGRVRVAIELRTPMHASSAAVRTRLTEAQLRLLRDRQADQSARRRIAARGERSRARALRAMAVSVDASAVRLRTFARRLERAGGRIVELRPLNNSLIASIPMDAIAAVRAWQNVTSVEPDVAGNVLTFPSTTGAMGTPTLWGAGHTGGTGSADTNPVDVAIYSDQVVEKTHPAFAGVRFLFPQDGVVDPPVSDDHGTPVAGMIASQGVSSCPSAPGYTCNPADVDPNKKGVAYGVDKVLDAAAFAPADATERYDDATWALGFSQVGFDSGKVMPGSSDRAEVFNRSSGSVASDGSGYIDDTADDRYQDGLVDQYGVLFFQADGNSDTSLPPDCRSYNVVCVGAIDHQGTIDPSDDQVAYYSTRGPTPAGRKKPDLVAPGTVGTVNANWKAENALWKSEEGTSFSSPAAAGGGLLLMGAGINDPLAVKALLIDSARQGRATPASAMGTQTGWQPDWGWGAVDLTAAYGERTNFDTGSVGGDQARFYSATTQAAGDRATLVWNRHATASSTTAEPLTDLDLYEHAPAAAGECDGATRASSTSTIDNVEQVRSPSAAPVVYRVVAGPTAGELSEPYAIAGTRQVNPLTPPVSAALSVDRTHLAPGETATVTATADNPSGQMTGCDPALQLAVSGPIEVVGSPTFPDGDPGNRLTPNEHFSEQWTVRATGYGTASITATASSRAYASTLTRSDTATISIPQPPPSEPTPGTTPTPNPTPTPTPTPAPTPTPVKVAPSLRMSTPTQTGSRLTIRGTISDKATGKVKVAIRIRLAGHTKTITKAVTARRGRFSATLTLPKRIAKFTKATLKVSYAGNRSVRAGSSTKTVRRKAGRLRFG